jgi:NADH-quinone oxidoreductase subunit C
MNLRIKMPCDLKDGVMDEKLLPAVAALQQKFGAESLEFRGETTLLLEAAGIVEACTILRDDFKFDMLESETAVDYWPQDHPRFHVVYHLYSYPMQINISLRVPLSGAAPSLPTMEGVFPNANWLEREIWDLFGIRFEGHSDLRRLLMPADWQGHPQRKDYPLGYEEVQFTFNFDRVSRNKPKAVK